MPSGHCVVTTQNHCNNIGGAYGGNGTVCSGTTCPPLASGACCVSNSPTGALCVITTEAFCTSHGGTYRGDGTTCATANCPHPTGACCLPGGGCQVLTPAACAVQLGLYRGNNVPCSAANCGRSVGSGPRGDWNNDAVVNIGDMKDYMSSYAAGLGDLNGDGLSNSLDVARFLELMAHALTR